MNYQNIYTRIINRALNRVNITYTESHHIVPRCMGGVDDAENLVDLTPEEHYIAHMLLVKIYPNHHKLIYAANMMQNRTNNNKKYGWLKRKFSELERINKTGIARTQASIEKQKQSINDLVNDGVWAPYRGNTHTVESRQKMSISQTGKLIPTKSRSSLEGYIIRYGDIEGPIKYRATNKTKDVKSLNSFIEKFGDVEGPIKYQENCIRLSESALRGEDHGMFGRTHTDETKALLAANTSKHQKGRLKTDDHKAKIGAANKGRKHTIVECPHCNKTGGLPSMKKWHFDNCKLRSSC